MNNNGVKQVEKFVTVDAAKLFCRVYGENHPPVIVLHGGPGLGQGYLLPQMAELGKFSSAIFYDQRGTGQSISNNDWLTHPFEAYVSDVDQVRQAFGLEKVTLLGHSWGAILATKYALAYPHHVDKMIYVNAVPLASADYLAFVAHRRQLVNANGDKLTAIRASLAFKQGDPATVEKYYRIYFQNYFVKPERLSALSLNMSSEAALNNFKIYEFFYKYVSQHAFDLYPLLADLNKKTLILACDSDVVPLHYMEKLHKAIPLSEMIILEQCGHFPYIDQPELLFKHLHEFLL